MVFIPPFLLSDFGQDDKEDEKKMGHETLVGNKQVAKESTKKFVLESMQEEYDTYKYKLGSESKIEQGLFWADILSRAAIELMDPVIGDMDPISALGTAKELLTKLKL